jgi:molecular chaperone GrpE
MKRSKSAGSDVDNPTGQKAEQPDNPVKAAEEPVLDLEAGATETETVAAAAEEEATADPCQELKAALAAKENDFAVLADKYLRLAAEYDNFRRRSQKEKDALYADSIVLVIREMLPVLDSLDRAELSAAQFDNEEARKIAEGIAMIQKQVDQALDRLGVSVIESAGLPFNPDLHEAVMHVEDEDAGSLIVVNEMQKGYRRDDRVIRHSMVTVAN